MNHRKHYPHYNSKFLFTAKRLDKYFAPIFQSRTTIYDAESFNAGMDWLYMVAKVADSKSLTLEEMGFDKGWYLDIDTNFVEGYEKHIDEFNGWTAYLVEGYSNFYILYKWHMTNGHSGNTKITEVHKLITLAKIKELTTK